MSYIRRAADEEVLVAINLSNRPFSGVVNSVKGAGFVDVTPDVAPPLPPDAPVPSGAKRKLAVELPALRLDAWGYRVFRRTLK